ncbi:MAG: HlyD family efflux transporter periplasmic adaptor subunit [bacterium]
MKIRLRILEDILKVFLSVLFSLLSLVAVFLYIAKIELVAKAEGIVEAENWVEARPKVSGIIKEMFVSEGDKVKRGDLLFKLEDEEKKTVLLNAGLESERLYLDKREAEEEFILFGSKIKNNIAEQEASISAARAELAMIMRGSKPEEVGLAKTKIEMAALSTRQAEVDYKRKEEEAELGLVSLKEKEEAKYQWELASANLEVAKKDLLLVQNRYSDEEKKVALARVAEAEVRLRQIKDGEKEERILRERVSKIEKEIEKKQNEIEFLKKVTENLSIYAKVDGIILTKETQQLTGRFVGPGETIIKIGRPKDYVVKAFIKEKDRPKVKEGQKAKIFVEAFPHGEYKVFKGQVTNVSKDRTEGGLYGVTIAVFDPYVIRDGKLYSLQVGYTVTSNIITEKDRIINILIKLLKRMKGEILPKNIYLFEKER